MENLEEIFQYEVLIYIERPEDQKNFNALDWLARLVTHIPGRYEQTVRYYGYYSNKSRKMRKKAETDGDIPAVIQKEMSS
ncbi:transposase [uncultured Desulfobacter sp.]|uniref:transposase n=1 Tax=uncultured Desulfobacter sp. TaxID=240139 RepID=UPI0029F4CD37|nr:transposase [uncultured Desulfobacter sp.]